MRSANRRIACWVSMLTTLEALVAVKRPWNLGWRRSARLLMAAVGTAVVLMTVLSMWLPIGGRPGVILHPGDGPTAWRAGVARGVAWYRREEPPLFRGQQLMWEETLVGNDTFGPWHRNLPWWKVSGVRRERPGFVQEWTLPVWPLAVVELGWLGWRAFDAARCRSRAIAGMCIGCGYVMAGKPVCPECGRAAVRESV